MRRRRRQQNRDADDVQENEEADFEANARNALSAIMSTAPDKLEDALWSGVRLVNDIDCAVNQAESLKVAYIELKTRVGVRAFN